MAKQYDFTEGNIFKQLFIFSGPIKSNNNINVILATHSEFVAKQCDIVYNLTKDGLYQLN